MADYIKSKTIISDDTGEPVTINVLKKAVHYMKYGHPYSAYFKCSKCKNASWYDDDYCNNQKLNFADKEDIKTTQVYCENFDVQND